MRSVFVKEVACCGGNMHGGVSGTRRMLGILSKNIQPIDRKSPANAVLGKKGMLRLGCGRRNVFYSGAARTVWAERLFLFGKYYRHLRVPAQNKKPQSQTTSRPLYLISTGGEGGI